MSGPLLQALSYGLLTVFLAAFLWRTLRIRRMPVHLRWELAPVPKEKDRGRWGGSYLEEYEWWKAPRRESTASELSYMLQEILFLKALWEHNRPLWWFSFPFHLGLYFLAAAAALGLAAAGAAATGLPSPGRGLASDGLPALAGAAYALGTLGTLGLLGRRLLDPALRRYTTPVAIFNLVLLLALFATGGFAMLAVPAFSSEARGFLRGLLGGGVPAEVPGALALHGLAILAFLAFLPFGQMMHFVAKYFTYHQVRWEDRPLEAGGDLERDVSAMLAQTPTWAAPHIRGDGKRTWVDVAVEEVRE